MHNWKAGLMFGFEADELPTMDGRVGELT